MGGVLDLSSRPAWSGNELKRLGKKIAAHETFDAERYLEIHQWQQRLVSDVVNALKAEISNFTAPRRQKFEINLIQSEPTISGRVKTLGTLRQKLQRENTYLSTLQDFAGARVDMDCGPTTQTAVAARMKGFFERNGADNAAIVDRRIRPSQGYRAVHLHVRAPRGRFEVQLRTAFQAKWANIFEEFADIVGREVRYGEVEGLETRDQEFVDSMISLSESFQETADSRDGAVKALYRWDDALQGLDLPDRLENLENSAEQIATSFGSLRKVSEREHQIMLTLERIHEVIRHRKEIQQ